MKPKLQVLENETAFQSKQNISHILEALINGRVIPSMAEQKEENFEVAEHGSKPIPSDHLRRLEGLNY